MIVGGGMCQFSGIYTCNMLGKSCLGMCLFFYFFVVVIVFH